VTSLIIYSNRVFLRPLCNDDAGELFTYRSKPEVAKYQLWKPVELNDAITFIKKARFYTRLINKQWNQFAICLRNKDTLIGDIGLLLIDQKAEIGYTIAPHFQRMGFAFEAVTSIIKYLFNNHIVNTIIAYTDPNNVPSIMLLRKIGFQLDSSHQQEGIDCTDLCFILENDIHHNGKTSGNPY
jgi:RimJ/RimL family protein N-acetyltransferase